MMESGIERRTLLFGLAASGLAASTPAFAAAKRMTFFDRIKRPIGLQLYTLGEEPAKDLDGVLSKLATIGYRDLELPGLLGKTPAVLKAAADRAGVSISCVHLSAMPNQPADALTLLSPIQRIVDELGVIGLKQAVMPLMLLPESFKLNSGETFQAAIARSLEEAGPDIWKRTAAILNEKAAQLKPHGISLGYHNHNVEFLKLGKTNGWDILAGETDKKLVSFEVDIGWLAAAGIDPVDFLKRHSGRVRQVHVKDVKASTKVNYALLMDPTEVGSGKLDWAKILPAAHKAGVRNFYVEQEAPFEWARMDAATKSFAFLAKLNA
jgi:sugar phosphate isomerase/epimerase